MKCRPTQVAPNEMVAVDPMRAWRAERGKRKIKDDIAEAPRNPTSSHLRCLSLGVAKNGRLKTLFYVAVKRRTGLCAL